MKIITTSLLVIGKSVNPKNLKLRTCPSNCSRVILGLVLLFRVIVMSPFLHLCTASNPVRVKSWHQTSESAKQPLQCRILQPRFSLQPKPLSLFENPLGLVTMGPTFIHACERAETQPEAPNLEPSPSCGVALPLS